MNASILSHASYALSHKPCALYLSFPNINQKIILQKIPNPQSKIPIVKPSTIRSAMSIESILSNLSFFSDFPIPNSMSPPPNSFRFIPYTLYPIPFLYTLNHIPHTNLFYTTILTSLFFSAMTFFTL